MAAEQRRMLERLMGSEIMGSSQKAQMSFRDPKVCRSFLCGDCPYELFQGTKMDLGQCPKLHSEKLRADYQRAKELQPFIYEWDQLDDLSRYVDDCDRRIDSTYRRLERTPEEITRSTELLQEMMNLEEQIDCLLDECEVFAELKDIVGIAETYNEIQRLSIDRAEREREIKGLSDISGNPNQKLLVCDVCGALLSKMDNDRRLADHFVGKLHQGYYRMRVVVKRLRKELEGAKRPEERERRLAPGDSFRRGSGSSRRHGGRPDRYDRR